MQVTWTQCSYSGSSELPAQTEDSKLEVFFAELLNFDRAEGSERLAKTNYDQLRLAKTS